jgi:hypothetical protein
LNKLEVTLWVDEVEEDAVVLVEAVVDELGMEE